MSYGAVKLEDGNYQSLDGRVVQPIDFENQEYVLSRALLTVVADFPATAIPELNKHIGIFLRKIQKSSFVHRSILNVVPPARHEWEEEVYDAESSTLPAIVLVKTIRQNIEKLVRDILTLAQIPDVKKDNSTSRPEEADSVHSGLKRPQFFQCRNNGLGEMIFDYSVSSPNCRLEKMLS